MSRPELDDPDRLAVELVTRCAQRGLTLGAAESLTGGLLTERLVRVPGASAVVRGAVVAYAPGVKRAVLGVPERVLQEHGAVSRACAEAMAAGARRVLGSDLAIATTGVAGPDPSEGHPVGTVHLAVQMRDADGEEVHAQRALMLCGSRPEIREKTVCAALVLALRTLPGAPPSTEAGDRGVP
ncbi:MAG TPA: nicotinamide-nucleotide amidohydrolase family protein [Ornithinimicrobium sp.]|uniref:CinA family protein n=1 Tax=Ornithinimicrobium sp. TaxID=1977084 RepID=UPI002B483548|nr:nicotinamide-nucleotide amidohydrolase family protein [Ornithinimicrobium sp.]HKJ10969.1 nicotinamide-nucleotide amidohydrolase family protein [Ornithinimicrobium sp.]